MSGARKSIATIDFRSGRSVPGMNLRREKIYRDD